VDVSWLNWYELNCRINNSYNEKLQTTTTTTTKSIISTQQLYFIWHSTITNNRLQLNSTTKIIKYDMSTAFYWISSFCIVIITFSCLFIVWFYCIKRFKFSRQLGLISTTNNNNRRHRNNNNNNNRHLNRQDIRRNIVLVNPRVNNQTTNSNGIIDRNQQNNNSTTSYPMNIYGNLRQQNNPQSDLYFISLPANRNGLSHLRTNNNNNNHDNLAYIYDDSPPNYYDIIVSNNRFSIDKESSNLEIIQDNRPALVNNSNLDNTELVLNQNIIPIDENNTLNSPILFHSPI
jgi:hypothetical protein